MRSRCEWKWVLKVCPVEVGLEPTWTVAERSRKLIGKWRVWREQRIREREAGRMRAERRRSERGRKRTLWDEKDYINSLNRCDFRIRLVLAALFSFGPWPSLVISAEPFLRPTSPSAGRNYYKKGFGKRIFSPKLPTSDSTLTRRCSRFAAFDFLLSPNAQQFLQPAKIQLQSVMLWEVLHMRRLRQTIWDGPRLKEHSISRSNRLG